MATSKPISTISYNTEPFLKEQLDNWLKEHVIMNYMYICHKGEDGDKDHIHLRIEPNKKLDVMDLMEKLNEYQIGKEKPLGVRPFRPSKEEDWICYAVHDADYLKTKYNEEKGEKLPYKWQDIKAPENYDVETAFIRAKAKLERTTANVVKRIKSGESGTNIIETGVNPFQYNAIMKALHTTDYQNMAAKYLEAQSKLDALTYAVLDLGYEISYDDEYKCEIVKVDK